MSTFNIPNPYDRGPAKDAQPGERLAGVRFRLDMDALADQNYHYMETLKIRAASGDTWVVEDEPVAGPIYLGRTEERTWGQRLFWFARCSRCDERSRLYVHPYTWTIQWALQHRCMGKRKP